MKFSPGCCCENCSCVPNDTVGVRLVDLQRCPTASPPYGWQDDLAAFTTLTRSGDYWLGSITYNGVTWDLRWFCKNFTTAIGDPPQYDYELEYNDPITGWTSLSYPGIPGDAGASNIGTSGVSTHDCWAYPVEGSLPASPCPCACWSYSRGIYATPSNWPDQYGSCTLPDPPSAYFFVYSPASTGTGTDAGDGHPCWCCPRTTMTFYGYVEETAETFTLTFNYDETVNLWHGTTTSGLAFAIQCNETGPLVFLYDALGSAGGPITGSPIHYSCDPLVATAYFSFFGTAIVYTVHFTE